MSAPRRLLAIAVAQFVVGSLLLFGVWVLLPARWWPIDVPFTALALLQLASAGALIARRSWASRLSRVAGWAMLVAGAGLVSALALTVAHLTGMYGPVGQGGALLMGVIAALVLPYLVLLPALQLAWLRAQR
jgi:hypothetical protein